MQQQTDSTLNGVTDEFVEKTLEHAGQTAQEFYSALEDWFW